MLNASPGLYRRVFQRLRACLCLIVLGGLAACAGSATAPTIVRDLAPDQKANLHLAGVSTAAAPGVDMTAADLARITGLVTTELRAAAPAMLEPGVGEARVMQLTVTRYDPGNAAARFLIAGLGQIHLDCTVAVLDAATRRSVAEYKVDKTFAFGGIYGGVTDITDVEKGLAKSIAQIVAPKP